MIEDTCCFTGHRDIPTSRYKEISDEIFKVCDFLYSKGVRNFICGGALGFDMIAAITVINMRNIHKDMNIILALPCKDHDVKWNYLQRGQMNTIKNRANETIYVTEKYSGGCMFARNRYMVDRSKYCIGYCNKHSGGSFYTLNYALKEKRQVINLYDVICRGEKNG